MRKYQYLPRLGTEVVSISIMKLDTEITAKSSVSAPLIILYYSSKANSAVPGQPFTSPRSIAKSSQPTIEIGVEVPILQPMGSHWERTWPYMENTWR